MKKRLHNEQVPVWFDRDNIGCSLLDSMSKAIEEALFVLIFYSEEYKNSANCRLEAEYIYQLKKPFIPIRVQENYKPDGWLGILIGQKKYFKLSLEKFENESKILTKQIHQNLKFPNTVAITSRTEKKIMKESQDDSETIEETKIRKSKNKPLECKQWTVNGVQEWVKKNKLNKLETP